MAQHIKDNGIKAKDKDMEYKHGLMAVNIKDNGKIIWLMV